jgi:hypothetical protein
MDKDELMAELDRREKLIMEAVNALGIPGVFCEGVTANLMYIHFDLPYEPKKSASQLKHEKEEAEYEAWQNSREGRAFSKQCDEEFAREEQLKAEKKDLYNRIHSICKERGVWMVAFNDNFPWVEGLREGRAFPTSELDRLAKYFNITFHYLNTGNGDPQLKIVGCGGGSL